MAEEKRTERHGNFGGGGHQGRFAKKEKIKNPKATLSRLLKYLNKGVKILILSFGLSVAVTLISVIGTGMNGQIIDKYIVTGNLSGLAIICIILIGLYVISAVSTFAQNRLMVRLSQNVTRQIRTDLFDKMQNLPIKYFDTHSSGDLMSRLTNDVDNINMTLSQSIIQFFSGIVAIIGTLIAMLLLNPVLTAIGMLTIPLMLLVTRKLIKHTQPLFVKQQKQLGTLNGYIEEMISGQKAILLFSRQKEIAEDFEVYNKELTNTAIMAQGISGFMGPINNFINNLSYLIIAVVGGLFILNGFNLTVGVVFTFILYMRNFTRPINEILNIFNTIQSALAGAERVFDIMDEKPEQDLPLATDIQEIKGNVTLKSVDFSYTPEKQILKKANINAKAGEIIAIVGPTGAGKTTIVNLLTKFYDINSGQILIDGKNIDEISRSSLRRNISMVLQDTFLFSISVMENIRYGRLDATDDEVIEAAKLANADHFIMQMDDAYNTVLSDNGGNISQGQRQLLAIARAIIAKSSVLILDEATSSIDTRTEIAIQKAMLHLMEGKTTFVIAHRLSTIKNADQILVINNGEIIENGKHDVLIAQNGFYANLYSSQFKNKAIAL